VGSHRSQLGARRWSAGKHYLPKNHDVIHWLELPVKTAAGQFATVSLIRRVDTTGGWLPADKPCDAQHAGDQERVDYSATYLFYSSKQGAANYAAGTW
jgi:hypothetical protein